MTRPAVIVDTNVIAAGLLTANAASPLARMLDAMLAAAFPYVLSEALLDAYRGVLVRPKLRKLYHLSVTEVDAILTELLQHAIVFEVPRSSASRAPDRGDQFLWDLLAVRQDFVLVTGDKPLLRDVGMRGRIIDPTAFVTGLDSKMLPS